ncbi:MAG: hypothetical protein Q8K60_02655 [Parachlamydiaceae bacterium]|nr:hypothetical protein [Parachlamydiaceae bacterium]
MEPSSNQPANFVHLIGDSTLDNIWHHQKNKGSRENPDFDINDAKIASVEGKLHQAFKQNNSKNKYKIINHAYDGFTTTSVLNGDYVGRVFFGIHWTELASRKDNHKFIAYQSDKKNIKDIRQKVQPLESLKESIENHKEDNHYVVLSVGGNDFRKNLFNPVQLFRNIFTVQKRYLEIVSKIQEMKSDNIKPILMFQYRTDANSDSNKIYKILKVVGVLAATIQTLSFAAIAIAGVKWHHGNFTKNTSLKIILLSLSLLYGTTRFVPLKNIKNILLGRHIGVSTFGCLLEKLYQPMLEKAKKDQIPVLDLSNSFNPFDNLLYTQSIEPNEKGSELIANGISYIVKDYENFKGKTVIHSDIGEYKIRSIIPKKWEVAYP